MDLYDEEDIQACVGEFMAFNEVDIDDLKVNSLPLDESTI